MKDPVSYVVCLRDSHRTNAFKENHIYKLSLRHDWPDYHWGSIVVELTSDGMREQGFAKENFRAATDSEIKKYWKHNKPCLAKKKRLTGLALELDIIKQEIWTLTL